MASMSTDRDGNRIVQFKIGQGRRKTVRLGKRTEKAAEKIRIKIDALVDDAIRRKPHNVDVATWVSRTERNDSDLYDKLAAVQLVPARVRGPVLLGEFVKGFIAGRSDAKWSTRITFENVERNLVEFFGSDRLLDSITPAEADDWRRWLARPKNEDDSKSGGQGLSDNTVRRRCGIARQFFRDAMRRRILTESPFAEMQGVAVRSNRARDYFVSRAEATAVLKVCPDTQWQVLFALSRYGGLRCPSEHLALQWDDVDFKGGRIRVKSCKTEHHEGKGERVIPLWPELRPYLLKARREAAQGIEFVITRYRDTNANLRTQLLRIIEKAEIEAWPKLFQNLRATRQTELEEEFPTHVVCAWLGNSERVASKHYLQVTDAHFDRALGRGDERAAPALQRFAARPVSGRSASQHPSKTSGNCNTVRRETKQGGRCRTRTCDIYLVRVAL